MSTQLQKRAEFVAQSVCPCTVTQDMHLWHQGDLLLRNSRLFRKGIIEDNQQSHEDYYSKSS